MTWPFVSACRSRGGRITSLAFAAVMVTASASAAPALLEWEPSAEPEVTGYRVYVVEAERGPLEVAASDVPRVHLHHLEPGRTYHFAVSAVTAQGVESELSEVVPFTAPRPTVLGLDVRTVDAAMAAEEAGLSRAEQQELGRRVLLCPPSREPEGGCEFLIFSPAGGRLAIHASADLVNWQLLGRVTSASGAVRVFDPAGGPLAERYYRVVVE